jgi:dsRNA-specific ribonuclease
MVGNEQIGTAERHSALRLEINSALEHGSQYPWALLSRLQAGKFYSDIVESLLGAVYIDSGSFEICEKVIERMGILRYLRRIVSDHVHLLHPKEELPILSGSEKVKYDVQLEKITGGPVDKWEYTCQVSVGEADIVKIGNGVSEVEIKVRAAEVAVTILKQRQNLP